MQRTIQLLLTILMLTSCRQSTMLTEREKANIIREVKQTLDNYCSDIKKSGLTAEFKYLDNSSDFFWVPPGYSSPISYDSVADVLRQNTLKYKSVDNNFDTLSIIPLNLILATYTGRLSSTMIDTSGDTITFSLVETGLLIKRTDGWKLLSGQTALINK